MKPCGCTCHPKENQCKCSVKYNPEDWTLNLHPEIQYCHLHANAERMKEFIEDVVKVDPHTDLKMLMDIMKEQAKALLKEIGE